MNALYFIFGGGVLLLGGLAFAVWRIVRLAKKVEGLERENKELKEQLEEQKRVTDIFTKPRGDKHAVIDGL